MRLPSPNKARMLSLNAIKDTCRPCDYAPSHKDDLVFFDSYAKRNYQALADFEDGRVRVVVQYRRGSKRHNRNLERLLLVGQPDTTTCESFETTFGHYCIVELTIECNFTEVWHIAMRAFSYYPILKCVLYVK